MKKYKVTVRWYYESFDEAEVEVEADSELEAETKAIDMAENHRINNKWYQGGITDGTYEAEQIEEVTQ